jgi:hypothetical protein
MTENVTKTYTPLSQIASAAIGKCSAMLPNKLQCWRAGDVQVIIQKITPPTGKDTMETVDKTEYQLCYRHAQLENQQDAVDAAKAETDAEAIAQAPAATTEASITNTAGSTKKPA